MARKKITESQLKMLREMMIKGVTPDEISKHFGIAISSVHNYKRQLKDAGVDIPDIRGKRPSDKEGGKHVESIITAMAAPTPEGFTINLNGVSIYISNSAKHISIGPEGLNISF